MKKGDLTYAQAIEKVMLANDYYAPLSLIYKEFEKHRLFSGKTPHQTIQERVQRDEIFTRIGLGVYALTQHLDKLPQVITPKDKTQKVQQQHTYIQGMIIEIGNMRGFDTYTSDINGIFINKKLGSITTLRKFPSFTYDRILRSARFVDVAWFNQRGFPERIFEVEHSTNFRSSLVKFSELQDFNVNFRLVAPADRETKYHREVSKVAFNGISSRCNFISYPAIEEFYESAQKYYKIANSDLF